MTWTRRWHEDDDGTGLVRLVRSQSGLRALGTTAARAGDHVVPPGFSCHERAQLALADNHSPPPPFISSSNNHRDDGAFRRAAVEFPDWAADSSSGTWKPRRVWTPKAAPAAAKDETGGEDDGSSSSTATKRVAFAAAHGRRDVFANGEKLGSRRLQRAGSIFSRGGPGARHQPATFQRVPKTRFSRCSREIRKEKMRTCRGWHLSVALFLVVAWAGSVNADAATTGCGNESTSAPALQLLSPTPLLRPNASAAEVLQRRADELSNAVSNTSFAESRSNVTVYEIRHSSSSSVNATGEKLGSRRLQRAGSIFSRGGPGARHQPATFQRVPKTRFSRCSREIRKEKMRTCRGWHLSVALFLVVAWAGSVNADAATTGCGNESTSAPALQLLSPTPLLRPNASAAEVLQRRADELSNAVSNTSFAESRSNVTVYEIRHRVAGQRRLRPNRSAFP
ncbi:hypothetical protein HPB50_003593 [Hyalomma asiaticum]|uniref:Uncharacterized protein n=1 Tax=Hyalomma asiaticum TaxID=266040 RepID=A0ACB7SV42_HYAAI|nr:hypothetical protein HPB50_003593 [Hyalomma asiaticum]